MIKLTLLICFAAYVNAAVVSGELRQWHKVTLTVDGPQAKERDSNPNPFTDFRMTVVFRHESGSPSYEVPGYFAADGNAALSSAEAGNKWRAHLSPDKPGRWTYVVKLVKAPGAALDASIAGEAVKPGDGEKGEFRVSATDKRGRDFRGKGRLQYTGAHYLKFAASGEYFLKAGTDSPETLLGYEDFDGTVTKKVPLKAYKPHMSDWNTGDPSWSGKGKGLIGALNYLSTKGVNSISFLTYNAGGDGDNVWPFVERDDKLHYDVSKLDQWAIVFDHAQAKGLHLHFKLQEQENDDNRRGNNQGGGSVPASLDGGALGVERKLYLRELIARYGYELALNWNMGEENTQSAEEQRAMAKYIRDVDPYDHNIVVHTFPDRQDVVYSQLVGEQSVLTGASLQNMWDKTHERTVQWRLASAKTGRRWVVANDEQGSAAHGVPPDWGYQGFAGKDKQDKPIHNADDIRKATLWGNLMGGGAGVEYYFGYQLAENDLVCEDFRSRDKSWDWARLAVEFFHENRIPFWEMEPADALVNAGRYAFVKADSVYVVYLPSGGVGEIDLSAVKGGFAVSWFDPRNGGKLQRGRVAKVQGGAKVSLGAAPATPEQDWVILLRR